MLPQLELPGGSDTSSSHGSPDITSTRFFPARQLPCHWCWVDFPVSQACCLLALQCGGVWSGFTPALTQTVLIGVIRGCCQDAVTVGPPPPPPPPPSCYVVALASCEGVMHLQILEQPTPWTKKRIIWSCVFRSGFSLFLLACQVSRVLALKLGVLSWLQSPLPL